MTHHPSRFVYAGAIAVVFGLTGVADAATRYAEPDGNGPEASCPAADPCDLTTAVEGPSVANGDEVVVLPGVHVLPGDLPGDGFSGSNPLYVVKAIDIHGAPGGPAPTIDSLSNMAYIYVNNPDAIVREVAIEGGIGLATGTAERVTTRSPVTPGCYFDKFSTATVPPPLIRDSVCSGGIAGASANLAPPADHPVDLVGRLVNVTAIGQSAGLLVAARLGSSATIEATNVIALGSSVDVAANTENPTGAAGAAATASLANSNYDSVQVMGPAASVTPAGTGSNRTDRPLLASPSTGDVHQVVGSPTIDAGAAVPLLGSLDFEGQARIQGPAPDVGADEGSIAAPFAFSAPRRAGIRDLAVTLRCDIVLCGFRIGGLVQVHGGGAGHGRFSRATTNFNLKQIGVTLGAGERRKVKVKLHADQLKEVKARLANGAKAEAVIDVDTGEGGFYDGARLKIDRPH
jgi:hypothetical protein